MCQSGSILFYLDPVEKVYEMKVSTKEETDKIERANNILYLKKKLAELCCGDGSCHFLFPETRGGQRTQGGCQCFRLQGQRLRFVLQYSRHLIDELEKK